MSPKLIHASDLFARLVQETIENTSCQSESPAQVSRACYSWTMASAKDSGVEIHVEERAEVTATFYYDHESKVQAVVLFSPEISSGPLEYRVWRAQWPLDPDERQQVLAEFDVSGKLGLTTEQYRSIPWGRMSHLNQVRERAQAATLLELFNPPTEELVDRLHRAGELMGFRNVRDLRAHAAELRILKPYLSALYDEETRKAVEDAAAIEGIEVGRARNLIVRAKNHGYVEKTPDAPLGVLTSKALGLTINM